MPHSATSSSVRITGVLILVWIGVYWVRTPGGDAAPLDVPAISQANPDQGPGTVLSTFDPELSGLLPHERDGLLLQNSSVSAEPLMDSERTSSETSDKATQAVRTYTVRQGDTLGDIAILEYGSITYANLVFEANRDQLDSPHDLDLGMVLRLPPKP